MHRDLKVSICRGASASLTPPNNFRLLPFLLRPLFLSPSSVHRPMSFLLIVGLVSACPTCLCMVLVYVFYFLIGGPRPASPTLPAPSALLPVLLSIIFTNDYITKAPVALTDSQVNQSMSLAHTHTHTFTRRENISFCSCNKHPVFTHGHTTISFTHQASLKKTAIVILIDFSPSSFSFSLSLSH